MKKTYNADARALEHIKALIAYQPGDQPTGDGWIKLNTNENPYPPSPRVKSAIINEIENLRLYPEPKSNKLRVAIGEHFGLTEKNVIIGNGSDNLLHILAQCFADKPGVGQTVPSYSLYPVVTGLAGAKLIEIPFDRSMRLDPLKMASSGASIFFLTSPNAPTGVGFSCSEIAETLERMDGLFVIDEAYVDFGGESAAPLLSEYENLVIVRTFSKSYGLAGLRVGYALASDSIIQILDKAREVYNVDRIAQAAALAAFQDEAYFKEICNKIIASRDATRTMLDAFNWFTYASSTNFLFTEPVDNRGNRGAKTAKSLFDFLKNKRVLVRYFPNNPLTCSFIRVSIGTDTEMKAFIDVTKLWLNQEQAK